VRVPVAVEVAPDAAGAALALSILAPESVAGLGVDESCLLPCPVSNDKRNILRHALGQNTVRIDHGKDVKVKTVKHLLDSRVACISGEQPEGEVFGHHGGDPLPRVHGPKEYHSRPVSGPRLAKEMKTQDIPLLEGPPGGKYASSGSVRPGQQLEILVVVVIGPEPCR
jgi:hypothetical protein